MCWEGCAWHAPGCGGAGPFSAQAPPHSPASGTIAPEFGPRGHNPLGQAGSPHSSPSLSHLKRWQRVVCYIPEGQQLAAGEGKPESRAERPGRGAAGWPLGFPRGQRRAGMWRAPADPECRHGELLPIACYTDLWDSSKGPNNCQYLRFWKCRAGRQACSARVSRSSGKVCFLGFS